MVYLVVDQKWDVGGLEAGVRGEDGVVGLDYGGGHLRGRVDDELQLGLSRELGVQSVHEEGREAGAGPAAERVENDESLQSSVNLNLDSRWIWPGNAAFRAT